MKIRILSDIHLEFGKFRLPEVEADVLLLCGDIGVGKSARNFIDECRKTIRTLYIPGNHEFYGGGAMEDVEKYWADVLGEDFLQEKSVTINGIKIAGATLWTDLTDSSPYTITVAQYGMSDFNRGSYWEEQRWTALRSIERHKRQLKFLIDEAPDVVMTHHAPSLTSIDTERYHGDDLNGAYASDLEDVMAIWNPKLWGHGHIHSSNDYIVNGKTRVVSNPRGYVGHEVNKAFNPSLVVEV